MLVLEFYLKKRATIDAMKTVVKVINDIKSVTLNLGAQAPATTVHKRTVTQCSACLVPS
jgi:hypothetical protein